MKVKPFLIHGSLEDSEASVVVQVVVPVLAEVVSARPVHILKHSMHAVPKGLPVSPHLLW